LANFAQFKRMLVLSRGLWGPGPPLAPLCHATACATGKLPPLPSCCTGTVRGADKWVNVFIFKVVYSLKQLKQKMVQCSLGLMWRFLWPRFSVLAAASWGQKIDEAKSCDFPTDRPTANFWQRWLSMLKILIYLLFFSPKCFFQHPMDKYFSTRKKIFQQLRNAFTKTYALIWFQLTKHKYD